jgi:hypothetical protein
MGEVINPDGSLTWEGPPPSAPTPAEDQEFNDLLAKAMHARRSMFHKPFHAGKRLIKSVGDYDNGIFFQYNAVPYGHHPLQYGKHRLIRPFDDDSGRWGKPMRLEQFVRDNRAKIRAQFRSAIGRRHAEQTMTAVECLRVGQSVYFYFWCWGTLAKRIK